MAISVPNVLLLVLTLFTWAGIHSALEEKDVRLFQSRILIAELIPAAVFSFSVVYYLIPATWVLVFTQMPAYASRGPFWTVMQFIGALIFTISSVGWVALLSETTKQKSILKTVEDTPDEATEESECTDSGPNG